MAKLQPYRDETLKDPVNFRVRLNEMVNTLNDSAGRWVAKRLQNVQAGVQVLLPNLGFTVGAIVVGGCNSTNGGAAPTSAPWCNWTQLQDGRISFTVQGLAAFPALYVVNIIIFEGEAAT